MATHTTSGNLFPGRTFQISRENGQQEKNGRPWFFEWMQEIPEDKDKRKFETRTSPNGARHYELFAAIDGLLTGVETEQKSFGDTKPPETWLVLYMDDDGEQYKIETGSLDGRYSMDVMKRLLDPNFNPAQRLRLSPFAMEKNDGGWNIGISAYSGPDGKLNANWKAEHLNGMPKPDQTEHKGRTLWDYLPVANWLIEQVDIRVIPTLGGALPNQTISTKITANHSKDDFKSNNNPAVNAGFPDEVPVEDGYDLPF